MVSRRLPTRPNITNSLGPFAHPPSSPGRHNIIINPFILAAVKTKQVPYQGEANWLVSAISTVYSWLGSGGLGSHQNFQPPPPLGWDHLRPSGHQDCRRVDGNKQREKRGKQKWWELGLLMPVDQRDPGPIKIIWVWKKNTKIDTTNNQSIN